MSKSFTDLRIQMGVKNAETTSIPSDIDQDEWGEITRFKAK